jgi:IS30 family transposase
MKSYTHLTQEERYQIYVLMKAGHRKQQVAVLLGRSPSTIGRELRRNRGQRGYRPKQAQAMAEQRAQASRTRPRITENQWQAVATLIRQDWSPEQIADRARLEGTLAIRHETIYQFVYADKRAGGDLWRHLRCQKPYRKRYGSGRERRGQIPGRVGIEQRPLEIERRERIGHWEADTIHGRRRQGAVLSLLERCSRLRRLGKLPQATAEAVRVATRRRLLPLAHAVDSLTADNGKEFAGHAHISADLDADFYFADPYSSWQRGTNENTNGLIRQYLPKSRDLTSLTGPELRRIENRLNYRPRKCLGYLTPYEAFHNTQLTLTGR